MSPSIMSSVLRGSARLVAAVLSIAILPLVIPPAAPALAQTDETIFYPPADSVLAGPLISASTAMETAWDLVRNPLEEEITGGPERERLVRLGFRTFIQTPQYAPAYSGNELSCGHCHINAGQREKALPLVGVATVFPEFNKRAGTVFTLNDRIVGCFLRSMNAVEAKGMLPAHEVSAVAATVASSEATRALEAYIEWLSEGYAPGDSLPWRGLNTIPDEALIPMDRLDSARGAELFVTHCANCHGEDGQGAAIGDIKAGPLWGPSSWNDGAGAARVYTLAGMVRHMMPFVNPGALTDEEAQHVSYFICTQDRPVFPFKNTDYVNGKIPPDAVYYAKERASRGK